MAVKKHTYRNGKWAEYVAAFYLTVKGYQVCTLRYKTKVGEIDIIARKGNTIIFTEVKFRQSGTDALHAVLPQAQQRIRRAAEYYLLEKRYESSTLNTVIRFDVVALDRYFRIKHIKNAF